MYPVMGYNTEPMTQPTRRGCPLSLQYALRLTAAERPDLTRIAQGRGGRRRPPLWQAVRARALLKCDAGPQGAGWTDETVAAAWDVSVVSVSRWRRQAVDPGPIAARAKRNSCSGPSPRRRPARRAGRCGRWSAPWWRGGLRPASVTRPCAAC